MPLLETDPVTLKLTSDGHIDVLAMATPTGAWDSGLTAVVTGARERILLSRGEWFLDLDGGVPWYERDGVDPAIVILGGKFADHKVRVPILQAILDTPGVIEVTQLSIAFDGQKREVSITWRARCAFGETPADSLIVGAHNA